jgi:MFS family permease
MYHGVAQDEEEVEGNTAEVREETEHHISPPSPPPFDFALIALCLCNAVDAVETLAFGSVLIGYLNPSDHTRIDSNAFLSGLLTTSVFIGMLIGGLIGGKLGDKFGRKPVLQTCMMINAISAVLAAWTSTLTGGKQVYFLALFRFLGGIGVGGSIPSVFALVAELGNNNTSKRVSLLATAWTCGSIFTSFIAWMMLNPLDNTETWPKFFLLCSIPAWLALLFTYMFVKEHEHVTAVVNEQQEKHWGVLLLVSFSIVLFAENFASYGT